MTARFPLDLATLPARSRRERPDLAFQRADEFAGLATLRRWPSKRSAPAPSSSRGRSPRPRQRRHHRHRHPGPEHDQQPADHRRAVPSPGQAAYSSLRRPPDAAAGDPGIPALQGAAVRYQQWFGWIERGRFGRVRKQLAEPGNTGRRWLSSRRHGARRVHRVLRRPAVRIQRPVGEAVLHAARDIRPVQRRRVGGRDPGAQAPPAGCTPDADLPSGVAAGRRDRRAAVPAAPDSTPASSSVSSPERPSRSHSRGRRRRS